jgi:hypothetical protein
MRGVWFKRYMGIYVPDNWKKLLNFVEKLINLGELQVYVDRYFLLGEPSVCFSFSLSLSYWSHGPFLATKPRDEDEDEDNESPNFWQGNRNRRLWKTTCTKAALNVSNSSPFHLLI